MTEHRDKISYAVLVLLLSAVAAYYTGQLGVVQSLAERPTRLEMASAVKNHKEEIKDALRETQGQTQRQLDDIKNEQEKAYRKVESLGEKLDKVLYELRYKNAGR